MELLGNDSKKDGDKCMKEEKYFEAMLHYTKGIKCDPHNPNLFLNRSETFLKIQQYYYALDDAKTVIRMLPKWPKGYLKKADVEIVVENFEDAFMTLKTGLEATSEDPAILKEMQKVGELWKNQRRTENRIPWFGVSLGFVIGIILIILDEAISKKPLLESDLIRSFSLMALVAVCYAFAWLYRYFIRAQRNSLIEAPVDLMGADSFFPSSFGESGAASATATTTTSSSSFSSSSSSASVSQRSKTR